MGKRILFINTASGISSTSKMKLKYKFLYLLEFMFILHWLLFLTDAESNYGPYLLVGITSICFKIIKLVNKKEYKKQSRKELVITNIFAIILCLMVVLANYGKLISTVETILVTIGGYLTFKEVLLGIYNFDGFNRCENLKDNRLIYLLMWSAIVIVDLIVLFGSLYPGVLTVDSISQVNQILTNNYSNHHPYYYTQVIRLCINLGMFLFNDINKAVCLYSCFSICMMALCFVYTINTIEYITNNKNLTIIIFLWYLMVPFHIIYAVTMWKDVFFGGVVTGLVVSVYRYLNNIGNNKVNLIVIAFMSLGMCLFRSNGFVAFAISIIIFVILFKNKYKKLLLVFIVVLISSYILKHPVLDALNVSQPSIVESLSIPLQQVSRVVVDEKKLTEKQVELINKVMDIDIIKERYNYNISDPIKFYIRDYGDLDYLTSNKFDYIKLYIEIGLKYPTEYIKAWVDQTKGYFNSGYDYWIWSTGLTENNLGINRTENSQFISYLLYRYCCLQGVRIIKPFISIGFHVWIIIICLYNAIMKRDKAAIFVTIPFLAIIFTLLIATPVFSEFRYAYALFCGMPFVIICSLYKEN